LCANRSTAQHSTTVVSHASSGDAAIPAAFWGTADAFSQLGLREQLTQLGRRSGNDDLATTAPKS
jgi:hypothetical protein